MDAPAIPLRNRLVVVVFLLVWGADQAVTVWQGVRGGIPAFMVLVTSATGPEDYPQVDTDGRSDPAALTDGQWHHVAFSRDLDPMCLALRRATTQHRG